MVVQARQVYQQRLKMAHATYPNSTGYESHHFIPLYLGGASNGQTYRLPTAYHKAVTQQFRRAWPYGQGRRPTPQELQKILLEVYLSMRETIEFRIAERDAREHLEPGLGVLLGVSIRKVVLPVGDPAVARIAQLNQAYTKRGDAFFMSWRLHRRYSARELQSAELLNLLVRASFEPTGAMCGTAYDESATCRHCGAGARQAGDLILDTRRIPKGKDIAQTLAGEVVVSPRLVSAFQQHGFRGADFRPVLHQSRGKLQPSDWLQLVVTAKPLALNARTVAGNNPFDLDENNAFRCPLGHTVGLNQISELYVERTPPDGADIWVTDKLFGDRRGELRPEPRILISPRLRDALQEMNAQGYALEAAHFV